jgi:tyrosyl-tRNA synthetase
LSDLSEAELRSTFNSIPLAESTFGLGIVDFLVKNQIASSNREAREFIQSGAIAINDQKITTEDVIVAKDMAIFKDILIVKRGKKKYFAVIAK